MSGAIIECVPNISEGVRKDVIEEVVSAAKAVNGVEVLGCDIGAATNRSVITFVGSPEAVAEGAFQLISKAQQLIDMRGHKGEHPRFGATDVCPFVPVANCTMQECIDVARKVAARVGSELGIPVYCYENAATSDERRNLATCRKGEYEGIRNKLADPHWAPDFGPSEFTESVAKSGCTAIGARGFLIAYNVNLNTTSTRRANAVAFDVREAGRVKTQTGKVGGKPVLGEDGQPERIPGKLKCVKGIGWYIDEYGIAQISYNLTDVSVTPMHVAFAETCNSATARGLRVTGSEIVGLVPKAALIDAADYYLRLQQRSLGISDSEKIKIAVKSLGLDDLKPFDPAAVVIEYAMKGEKRALASMTVTEFTDCVASEAPAPGGGSVAAMCGSMGAGLATMVANLSSHKRGWDDRWEEFSQHAVRGHAIHSDLVKLIDDDTKAFDGIMSAYGLPKETEEQKQARSAAIQAATVHAIQVPLRVMELSVDALKLALVMANDGLPASASDVGVAALSALASVKGAGLNVRINAASLKDKIAADKFVSEAKTLQQQACEIESEVLAKVDSLIG